MIPIAIVPSVAVLLYPVEIGVPGKRTVAELHWNQLARDFNKGRLR